MENYFRMPEREMPWNIRLLLCSLFLQALSLTLVIALLASLGSVVRNVSDMVPEVSDTLQDAQKMLPNVGDTLLDLNKLIPEVRQGLEILRAMCAHANCTFNQSTSDFPRNPSALP
tara:strand:- start:4240 stop:4587 length:348 start_codon:yes stop_codon:yes gene_type:complete